MQSISDEQFVTWSYGLRRSERKAYAAVFDATYDALYAYSFYITHERDTAHDVVQDVFLKLWQVRETIDPERSLKALLYQMVRNYSLNQERRKKTHATDSLDEKPVEPIIDTLAELEVDTNNLSKKIQSWIDQMPDRRREAFVLSRFEGLSHDEIARIMALTPRTVNNHIVLALQHIRTRLAEYDQELLQS